jgi:hypothetical protein
MNKRIGCVCVVLWLFWGVALDAQSIGPAPSTARISPTTASPLPAKVAQTSSSQTLSQKAGATHWYANAANVGLLATVFSAITAIFYTVLTAIIVYYNGRQTLLQKKASDIQIFAMVVQRLEVTRADRAAIRDYVKRGNIVVPPPSPVLEAVDRVCREFDFVGFIERKGLIDKALVDEFYSVPFVFLYKQLLGKYVNYLRDESRRGRTHFWELVQFYERVRYVAKNHPSMIVSSS